MMAPLLEHPPPVHPYAKGSWGPAEAEQVLAGLRPLARPVGGVMSTTKVKKSAPARRPCRGRAAEARASMPQSAAAPSPFTPIADYAFLSDCHTGALVAPDGTIDWLCVPRFDSPSVFGSLLDRGAGAFRLGPFGINVPSGRIYEPGTNTLVTAWKTPSGWATVRDALTMGPRRGEDTITPAHAAADRRGRRAHAGADGRVHRGQRRDRARVRARVRLRPRAWRVDARRRIATAPRRPAPGRRCGCRPTCCSGSRPTTPALGTFCREGEELFCALSWDERRAVPATVEEANARLNDDRRASGATGCGRARIPDHELRPLIQRSALAIKGLTYMPTGATVAALTTSLPETPGGERNWDYRYTWIRDSTFTLQALHFLDLDWEANEFMQFIADLERNEDGGLQIMYGIDGRRDLTETLLEELSGYAGARPGADRQRRLRPAPERRVRRGARLGPAAHAPQPAPAAAAVAADRGPGGVRQGGVAQARPGHLGGARQAAALRLLEADVLGGDGPRGQARRHPWGARPGRRAGRDSGRDQGRHPRARGRQARGAAPALRRPRRSTPRRCWPPSSASYPATTSGCARACWRSPTS